ncbi:MAG: dTDP-4-dehydrorhamnose 3,5-epimerase family protein [Candidatus Latescibacteria bacterium]|jgi:dTDP-4-dehydrorhamnose 3,5-epimerase|nr:dTDP-4-dehydrorhamnose 3,5-epimerase family protein [Candidatus Latescibacterota bacterium]MDP7236340.1 dTDP-4-dehydrorhamnose 3,5-epimerase family protein [Candidatus Latescibacterota bacterium]
MKIIEVKALAIPEIKVVRFGRFMDHRGYFTEPFRASDLHNNPVTDFLRDVTFVQENESYSKAGVIRGMHFQWNPYMGKFVRTLRGRMVDLVLDIRKGSPTLGKMIAYDIPDSVDADYNEWIWVPPGFAHGNFFTADSTIEYFCSSEYSPGCEAGISPLASDIDWSMCDPTLKADFDNLVSDSPLMSDKDRDAITLNDWLADERSEQFLYTS